MHLLTKNQNSLIYISITILSAYLLNFVITNRTTWTKEFPPKLPATVFISLHSIINLLFVALSFEPIITRKRCYALMLLLLLNLIIPYSYRLKFHPIIINPIVTNAALSSFKMCLFIKYNRKYLGYTKINQRKEFTPYILTLFTWRPGSDVKLKAQPTTTQIDEKIKSRALIFIWKWMVYETIMYLFVSFPQKVPEKPFQVRVIEYLTKGIPVYTAASLSHSVCFFAFIFLYLSMGYDFTVILNLVALRCINTIQPMALEKHFLVKSGLLTTQQFTSIKDYLIEYTFNTEHCFTCPWISTSPREFWSIRWQTMFAESFKELGYLPAKNLCINVGFTSRKFCDAVGGLGAFFMSALLHEYYVMSLFNIYPGEQLCFFTFHCLLLIIWEGIFGVERKNVIKEPENKGNDFKRKVGTFLKWALLFSIFIFAIPCFVEPLMKRVDRWVIPLFFTDIHKARV